MNKIPLLVIAGPTASGKTALAIELSKRLNGEIISCDSMQIYKRMDIGTAKPDRDEQMAAPHRLIDIVEPTVDFSCADYSVLAKREIEEIAKIGKTPILCGGTGLYVDHVLNNTSFSDAGSDENYRAKLMERIENEGVESVYDELKVVDPVSAGKIHKNNVKRVIRALEIYHLTGKTKSYWDEVSKRDESPYDARFICLDYKDRDKLYERIDKRVDKMIELGLVDEVKGLVSSISLSKTAQQGIGYKEIIDYLGGKMTLDQAIDNIKKGTRNYAKRQLTWFRRYGAPLYVDECQNFEEVVKKAENMILG